MGYQKSYKSGNYTYSSDQIQKQKGASRQLSIKWTIRWLLSKIPFSRVAPPKTLRAENYRQVFMNKNPGLILPGLYICAYCFKPITAPNMQVDHINPLNKGGLNWTPNFVPACARCNHDKLDHVWGKKKTGFIIRAVTAIISPILKLITLGKFPKKIGPLKHIWVNWVVLGRIGKVIYTMLQVLSTLVTGLCKVFYHLLTDILMHPKGVRGLFSKIFWICGAVAGVYFGIII